LNPTSHKFLGHLHKYTNCQNTKIHCYDFGFKIAGVYSIPCECGKVYIDRTKCSIETWIKEHHWHIRLYHPDKLVMVVHSTDLGHSIQFQDTRIMSKKTQCMEHFIRKAVEIELHPDNSNRKGFSLSKS
jgi:hypothetical protein